MHWHRRGSNLSDTRSPLARWQSDSGRLPRLAHGDTRFDWRRHRATVQCYSGTDGRPVAIASLTPNDFSPPNVLLDLIDPSVPRPLCTYRGLNWTVRFIGASQFAYAAGTDGNPSDGVDGTFDIPAATNRTVRRWDSDGFGAYAFAWSRDGALAYILAAPPGPTWGAAESWEIHLMKQGQDHTLTTARSPCAWGFGKRRPLPRLFAGRPVPGAG